MRRILGFVLAGFVAAATLSGCGPSVSEEELGTVLYEVPEVSGAEEPYQLPETTSEAPDDSHAGHSHE